MKPARVADLVEVDADSVTAVITQLRQATGLDPATMASGAIVDGIVKRLRDRQLQPSAYVTKLALGDAEAELEIEALLDALGIGETWFFRDREPFICLRQQAVAWRERCVLPPYRVLSVPCATGEEPFSVAMILRDAGLSGDEIHIDACDLRRSALAQAQHAVYRDAAFRGDDLVDRARCFVQTPAGFALRRDVVDLVHFRRANLMTLDRDVVDSYDVILCRNVMIYLDPKARERVVETVARLLAPAGLLLTGHVEAHIWQRRFTPLKHPGAFAFAHPQHTTSTNSTGVTRPPLTTVVQPTTRPSTATKKRQSKPTHDER